MNQDRSQVIKTEQANAAATAAALIKSTAEATATSLNIQYIQKDILDIKALLKELSASFVSKPDFIEHLKMDDDHEKRLRDLEKNMWKWTGAALVGASVLSTVVNKFLL